MKSEEILLVFEGLEEVDWSEIRLGRSSNSRSDNELLFVFVLLRSTWVRHSKKEINDGKQHAIARRDKIWKG